MLVAGSHEDPITPTTDITAFIHTDILAEIPIAPMEMETESWVGSTKNNQFPAAQQTLRHLEGQFTNSTHVHLT